MHNSITPKLGHYKETMDPNIEADEPYRSIWELLTTNNSQENENGGQRSLTSIFKVPPKLRKENESAYSPRVVSIGPIHRDTELVKDMEKQKVSYMQSLISRTSRLTKSSDGIRSRQRSSTTREEGKLHGSDSHAYQILRDCVDSMTKVVGPARAWYGTSLSRTCDDDGEFAQMMLLDGCFIIELVYRSKLWQKLVVDPILGNNLVLIDIRHDLLLLENQIPWFVLSELFNLTVGKFQDQGVFLPLNRFVLDFFGNVMNFHRPITKKNDSISAHHILDLLHQCYQPPHDSDEEHDLEAGKVTEDEDEYHPDYVIKSGGLCAGGTIKILEDSQISYSATALDNAGVNFHARKGEVLDISFSISCWFSFLCGAKTPVIPTCYVYNPARSSSSYFLPWLCRCCGVNKFEISPLCLYDSTESILRNLIAYEQCKPDVKRHITSYVFLMHTIISSKEDVELLVKAKVLENNLGESEDALNLFNNLCKEVVLGEFCFSKPWKVVHEHCKRYKRRNLPSLLKRNCASLTRFYCSSRWAAISVIAALILFTLQVLQTVYTVRSSK